MAGRAVGSHDFDPAVRNPDWLAERLLGPDERALLNDSPMIKALDLDYRQAVQNRCTNSWEYPAPSRPHAVYRRAVDARRQWRSHSSGHLGSRI